MTRITVKLVSNHYWCPALAWLKVHGPGVAWRPPHFTPEHAELVGYGDIISQVLDEALRRITRGCSVLRMTREKWLYSSALKLSGSVDLLVECTDKTIVVEAKLRRPRRDDPAYIQVGLYMILAEHNGYRNVEGYVAYPDGLIVVEEAWKTHALKELRYTVKTIGMNHPPPPRRPSSACRTCIFRRVCPYP